MHDAFLVRHGHAIGQLPRQREGGGDLECLALLQQVVERDALDVFHRQVVDAHPLAEVVRPDNVPM